MSGGSDRGAIECAGCQDLDSASSQILRREAGGPIPMNLDPVYPEAAFGNPERIDPTDCFGPYAQGGPCMYVDRG